MFQQSPGFIKEVLDSIHDALFIHDYNTGKIVYVNKRMCEMYNCTHEQALNYELINTSGLSESPFSKEDAMEMLKKTKTEGDKIFEWKATKFSGEYFWVEVSLRYTEFDNKPYVIAVVRDISERKESEIQYRTIFENTGTATIIIEENTIISLANSKFEDLSGYSKEEIENKMSWKDTVVKEDLEFMEKQHKLRRINAEEALKSYEFRFVDKSGNQKYILLSIDIIPNTKRSIASLQDITERKKAENELKESEKRYRLLFEHNPAPMLIYERGTLQMLSVNESFIKHYGYKKEQIASMKLPDFYPEEQKKPIVDLAGKIQGHAYAGEWKHCKADGTLIDIIATSHDILYENKNARIAVINDITERKKVEAALSESEERYRLISTASSDYMFSTIVEETGNLILNWAAGAFENITGYSFDEYKAIGGWRTTLHPDDIEKDKADMAALMANRNVVTELRTIKKSGEIIWVRVYAHPIWDKKKKRLAGIYGAVKDITERKKVEAELRESEEKYRTLIESAIDSIMIIKDGVIEFVNHVLTSASGYTANELIGQPFINFVSQKDRKRILQYYNKRISGDNTPIGYEANAILKNGTEVPVEITASVFNYFGKKAELVFLHDITERKLAEKALKKSEETYRLIFEYSPLGIFSFDEKGVIVTCNDNFVKIIGSSKEKLIGLNIINLPDKNIVSPIRKALNGKPESYEGIYTSFTANKTTPVRCLFAPMDIGSNGIHGGLGIVEDITERKESEEKLLQQKMELDSIFNTVDDVIFLLSVEGENKFRVKNVNKVYKDFTSFDTSLILGKILDETLNYPSWSTTVSNYQKAIEQKTIIRWEETNDFPTGTITVIHSVAPVYDQNGKCINLVASLHNITERKIIEKKIRKINEELEEKVKLRTLELEKTNVYLKIEIDERTKAEDLIKHQLEEREILLKEIHHRVKNNMQVIISILNLQASFIKNKKIVNILQDSQSRVKTMALIHEKLYQTKDFSNINFLDYITNLIKYLFTIYNSTDHPVEYKISAEPFPVSIDTTISLGLMTNEIVSNSFKYAFEGKTNGKIEISLKKYDEKNLVLSIKDNGKGLPPGFDCKNTQSLGLQLVCLLTEQIQGKLKVESSDKGTKFSIIFPSIK
ncbi:MAG TPA: PAS domain S-box protein [Bacteroidales bacterium]|nr:PAS domain S-box protein [Bacteroidales bacterium]HPS15878.1 PAS domain S-box protein [Bacteroidales bacterium]